MESSAHSAGKPDDSNSLMSKLTDRSVGSVIGFEMVANSVHRGAGTCEEVRHAQRDAPLYMKISREEPPCSW